MHQIKTLFDLIKYKVSFAVTFTATAGYLICLGKIDFQISILALGVFVLAGGSSALNEWQEREFDAIMTRTHNRPIPSGRIAQKWALFIALTLIVVGLLLLYQFFNTTTASLGLFNVLWYNGFYTHLKRITPFAVVPGSLVGAVPLFIGWCAAGGDIFDATAIYIAFFLFIWQIPHFWLLMIKYGDEYAEAGFPTINQKIQTNSLNNIILSWVVATSFWSISLPVFLNNISWVFFVSIFILNILFISTFTLLYFQKEKEKGLKKQFVSINIYMIAILIMLVIYHLTT